MSSLNIVWKKELKNCVPFRIFVNGSERGLIKRGESVAIDLEYGVQGVSEIYFVPKAPKWFGWRALKLNVGVTGQAPTLTLGVQYPGIPLLGTVSSAINPANQLHCTEVTDLNVTNIEYIKKYPRKNSQV